MAMNKKASFYILTNQKTTRDQTVYACRVIEKAFNSQHRVYVYLSDLETAKSFDDQLWTFRDISFVPHQIYELNIDKKMPVLIGYTTPPSEMNEVLVNLTVNLVPAYNQFQHLIEIVLDLEDLKKLARQRFQHYKKAGYRIEVFEL